MPRLSDGFDNQYAIRVDDTASTLTYVGKAFPGSSSSALVWQIQRLRTEGTVLAVEWPNGTADAQQRWADRTSLSYS